MTKVMIAVPTVDGWVHAKLIKSLIPQLKDRPFQIIAGLVPLEMARNVIAENFMASDCTHLFMVDADTIPPDKAIDYLLAVNKGFATGITPIVNKTDVTSNVFLQEEGRGMPISMEEVRKKEKEFQITGCGLACALIAREVFEKLERPYFTSLWFQNGDFIEGDIHFCNKVREAGFTLWADPAVMCGHVKTVTL